MKSKITLLIMLAVIALSSVACGNIGNVQPITGDSRNINQITNEVQNNLDGAYDVVSPFNQVWSN